MSEAACPMWYLSNGKMTLNGTLLSDIKELLIHATTWMNIKEIMLSEIKKPIPKRSHTL